MAQNDNVLIYQHSTIIIQYFVQFDIDELLNILTLQGLKRVAIYVTDDKKLRDQVVMFFFDKQKKFWLDKRNYTLTQPQALTMNYKNKVLNVNKEFESFKNG